MRIRLVVVLIALNVTGTVLAEEEKNDNFLIINGKDKITLTSGLTMVSQRSSGLDDDQAKLAYSLDMALEGQMGMHGYIFVSLNTAQGQSIDTGVLGGTNADEETDLFNVTQVSEARYDACFSDQAYMTIGKIYASGIYDGNEVAGDKTTQFVAGAFVNNVTIPFPAYSFGVNFTYEPTKSIKINVGTYEPTTEFSGALEDTFFIGEVAWNTKLAGHDTNLRLTSWDCNACFVSNGLQMKNSGHGLNADFALNEDIRLFARLGHLTDPMEGFDQTFSLGGQYELSDNRTAGVGYSWTAASENGADDETIAELYYSYRWQRNVTFTVDAQMISNAGFDGTVGNISVFGVRSQVDF